jgi:hypothetical protein
MIPADGLRIRTRIVSDPNTNSVLPKLDNDHIYLQLGLFAVGVVRKKRVRELIAEAQALSEQLESERIRRATLPHAFAVRVEKGNKSSASTRGNSTQHLLRDPGSRHACLPPQDGAGLASQLVNSLCHGWPNARSS